MWRDLPTIWIERSNEEQMGRSPMAEATSKRKEAQNCDLEKYVRGKRARARTSSPAVKLPNTGCSVTMSATSSATWSSRTSRGNGAAGVIELREAFKITRALKQAREMVAKPGKSAVVNVWVDPNEYAPGTKN
jgi:hypothetical protein